MMARFRRLAAIAIILLAGGCGAARQRGGIDEACSAISFEGSRFTVCHALPAVHDLLLVDRDEDGDPMRDFDGLPDRLGPRAANIAFAMNAGMFDDKGLPIGYYVEDGTEQKSLNRRAGPGNFHMQPNGVFYGDASGWHVAASADFAARKPDHVRFATQSGPMLAIDGQPHPDISPNGSSLLIRNAVGVGADGTAWFAISDEPVSFGRFARLFLDRLACPNALYLDGKISRLWDPVAGRRDAGAEIGPIVVAIQKR